MQTLDILQAQSAAAPAGVFGVSITLSNVRPGSTLVCFFVVTANSGLPLNSSCQDSLSQFYFRRTMQTAQGFAIEIYDRPQSKGGTVTITAQSATSPYNPQQLHVFELANSVTYKVSGGGSITSGAAGGTINCGAAGPGPGSGPGQSFTVVVMQGATDLAADANWTERTQQVGVDGALSMVQTAYQASGGLTCT